MKVIIKIKLINCLSRERENNQTRNKPKMEKKDINPKPDSLSLVSTSTAGSRIISDGGGVRHKHLGRHESQTGV